MEPQWRSKDLGQLPRVWPPELPDLGQPPWLWAPELPLAGLVLVALSVFESRWEKAAASLGQQRPIGSVAPPPELQRWAAAENPGRHRKPK